jgi:glycosyltransferase involved in cell wall biosynthesis
MNILIISPFDLVAKRLWGPTIRLHSLAKELGRRGHKVILAGPPPFDGEMPAILDEVEIYYFRKPFHRYPYPHDGREIKRSRNNRRRRLPLVMLTRIRELFSLTRKLRTDVLYVNRAFFDTAYPALATHLIRKIPIICDWDDLEGLHGFSTENKHSLKIQLAESFNEVVFPRIADATVVASNYLKDFAVKIGVNEENLYFAPTVADSMAFNHMIDGTPIRGKYELINKKVLFYCGNLMEANGVKVENIIYTLNLILQKDSSFALLIVGDGDMLTKNGEKGSLIKLAESLGIANKVIFTGGVPYSEVPKYVAAADMCLALFPVNLITMSKSPLKVYEYLAAGKAVIGRNIGEISRCIENGKNGILTYSDDPEEYAEKILNAFSSDGYIKRLGQNARKTIDEKFSWGRSADTVLQACQKVIDKKKIILAINLEVL